MTKNVDKNIQFFKYSTLKGLLKDRSWTAKKLSVESGLSSGLISNILSGKRQPRIDSAVRLAKALGVPINYLIAYPYAERSVNLPLYSCEFTKSLEKFIIQTIKNYCKNCENFSEDVKFSEKYVLSSADEVKMLAEFRRNMGKKEVENKSETG